MINENELGNAVEKRQLFAYDLNNTLILKF